MTMVMTTIHKSSFEGEVDQWLTMVDRIIVYKVNKGQTAERISHQPAEDLSSVRTVQLFKRQSVPNDTVNQVTQCAK